MKTQGKPAVRHYRHAGFTIPAVAAETGIPESVIRRAVKAGDIESILFAGLPRIPPREVARIKQTFEIKN